MHTACIVEPIMCNFGIYRITAFMKLISSQSVQIFYMYFISIKGTKICVQNTTAVRVNYSNGVCAYQVWVCGERAVSQQRGNEGRLTPGSVFCSCRALWALSADSRAQ